MRKKTGLLLFALIFTTMIYELTEIKYGFFARSLRPGKYLVIGLITACSLLLHQKRKGELGFGQYCRVLAGSTSGQTGRIVYLDDLRVLATILVIVIHVLNVVRDGLVSHTPAWGMVTAGTTVFYFCNVLFMMISGALLLGRREEPLFSFYKKRFLRVLVPCFMYYLFYCFNIYGTQLFYSWDWQKRIGEFTANSNGHTPHFWLVHVIMMFYLAAPFFSAALRNMGEKQLTSFAVMIFLLQGLYIYLPCFQISFSASCFFASWDAVFLLGYFCTTEAAIKHYRWILAGGGISLLMIFYFVHTYDNYISLVCNSGPLMLFLACSVFLFFRKHKDTLFGKASPLLSLLNKYSYSVLLIHWFVLYDIVGKRLGINGLSFGVWGGVPLTVLLTLAISLAFALLYDNTIVLCADSLFQIFLSGGRSRKRD